jgi:hypothetical protein
MRCSICGIRIDSVDEAVEAGSIPTFYDGETEHDLACPACSEALLQMGEDGEMEVKEEYRGKLIYFENETGDEGGEENLAKEIFFSRENENRRN